MDSSAAILSPADLSHCVAMGWVRLPEAFPREVALAMQNFMWQELQDLHGIERDMRKGWDTPLPATCTNRSANHPALQPLPYVSSLG